ncbi:glycosyltransferase family 2 protein [Paenibacillus hamazuiensis]|uniref:glycosyltransferase family 2 protein n=1 Tax=Paenibacillus hamazuiensis TaxID=2936508 RepID=UPI00200EAD5E|nr:glycosyltransferase family 2 protein [Paenibacillus hamazuiensis]
MAETLIIIPAFNEEKSIGTTLHDLLQSVQGADILVVNDGSVDGTAAISGASPIWVLNHPVNLGYGAALQSGYKFAARRGYRYVVQFDADGQHATGDLIRLIGEMRKNDTDVVIGSRFLGDPNFDPGLRKKLAINTFRSIIFALTQTRVTDPTSGLRGLHEKVFRFYSEKGRFPSDYPDADIIIHMLLNRFRIREFPIGSRERKEGISMHSGFKPIIYMFKVMLSILAVFLNHCLVDRRNRHA